jgi:hypothetical protein
MKQMARNLTMAGEGMLQGCRYLLHDRDARFGAAVDEILRSAGIEPIVLPPQSPNLNAHHERWNRSVKEECLSKIILFGEASLRHVLSNYVHHFHGERNHQGEENVILFPAAADRIGESSGEIRTRMHGQFLLTLQLAARKGRCNGAARCNFGNWLVAQVFGRRLIRRACLHLILDGHGNCCSSF